MTIIGLEGVIQAEEDVVGRRDGDSQYDRDGSPAVGGSETLGGGTGSRTAAKNGGIRAPRVGAED